MLGQPTWQDVMGLLRDNTLRAFRIDIETDSTIEPNDQDEKQRRVEFITAVGEYVSKSIPAVQLMPQLLPVIAERLKFLVRGFRVGREMEDIIPKALDQLSQAAGQGQGQQQPKGPDPKAEQMEAQAAQTTAQAPVMDVQTNAQRAQTDAFAAHAGADIEGQRVALESQHQHLDRAGRCGHAQPGPRRRPAAGGGQGRAARGRARHDGSDPDYRPDPVASAKS